MTQRVVLDLRNSYDSLRGISNEYLEGLDPLQFRRVTVLLRGSMPEAMPVDGSVGIPAERVVFFGYRKKAPLWRLRAAWRLYRLCRVEQVEWIIAHRFKSQQVMGMAGLLQPVVGQIAVVHGLSQLATKWQRVFAKVLLRKTTFVGVSAAVAADVTTAIGSKVAVTSLPNVIDVQALKASLLSRSESRQQLGVSQQAYIIGHVARLSGSKDQATLLRAFAIAREAITDAHLVIVGEGAQRERLEKLVGELDIKNQVTFSGWQNNAPQLMAAFDQFALTSTAEGFGLVLLEAMVATVPIVATDAGGIAEVVGNCCQLCAPGDIDGIAGEMVRLAGLSSEELDRLDKQMADRVAREFDRPIMRQRLAELLAATDPQRGLGL